MPDPFTPLSQLLEDGLQQGVYTAAAAVVGLQGELQWQAAVGRVSRDPEAPAVTAETSLRPRLSYQTPGHRRRPDAPDGPGQTRTCRQPG